MYSTPGNPAFRAAAKRSRKGNSLNRKVRLASNFGIVGSLSEFPLAPRSGERVAAERPGEGLRGGWRLAYFSERVLSSPAPPLIRRLRRHLLPASGEKGCAHSKRRLSPAFANPGSSSATATDRGREFPRIR